MQCIQDTLGPEVYFTAILVLTGGIVRGLKKVPFIKPDMLPALAFFIGWAIDGAILNATCGVSYTEASVRALVGGLAGLGAAGGHEALMRTARGVGLESLANKLLGRAKEEQDK